MRADNPTTPEEWQHAADLADILLLIDAARQYGLVEGGPDVNVERCEEIIERAAARGIVPAPSEDLLASFVTALAAE